MFKVFQVTLSEGDCLLVNGLGWAGAGEKSPNVKAYVIATLDRKFQEAFATGQFKHVATIEADDLDEVFEIGNIGPEELITRHAPMHSVSVGDVIQTPEGEFFAVASMGFESLVA
jgi:hypothetical protein